jgi:hypothetical protein
MAPPGRPSLALWLLLSGLLASACARQAAAPTGDGPCLDGGRRCAAAAAADRPAPAATVRGERAYPCRNRESGQADICFDTDLGRRNRGQLGPRY